MNRRDFIAASGGTVLAAAGQVGIGAEASPAGARTSTAERLARVQGNDHVVYHARESSGYMGGFPPPKQKRVRRGVYPFRTEGDDAWARCRWAFLHGRELFPTQPISRGNKSVSVLRARTRVVDGISVFDGRGGEIQLSELLEATCTDAFLILHEGNVVTEQYFPEERPEGLDMRPNVPHGLMSMSKGISACVVANVLDQGLLEESAELTEYIPELQGTGYEGATIRHALDMLTNGVEWAVPASLPAFGEACGISRSAGAHSDEGVYDYLTTLKRTGIPHGSYFQYKEIDSRVLAWACERVTNRGFAHLLSEMIWSKLGAEEDAYVASDGLGCALNWAFISATLRDVARWGQMLLNGGRANGTQVVPERFVEDIRTRFDRSKVTKDSGDLLLTMMPENFAYRSQFFVLGDPPDGDFVASGGGGQYCYLNPRTATVIVKFSTHSADRTLPNTTRTELRAFRQIAQVLGGKK